MLKGLFHTTWRSAVLLAVVACEPSPRFEVIPPEHSQITFSNHVTPQINFSILDYPYFYNGGGVAVADFDQDGLPDLYFTANQGPNRLYRNLGDFRFEDLTVHSATGGPSEDWATGASVVDINADGLPDLYVCYLGGELGQNGRNRLFVNQGNWQFREEAEAYGLAIQGMTTQAVFFDYDRDGDLDCYLLKHSVRPAEVVRDTALRRVRDPFGGDQLLRNDNGKFVPVSDEAGISGSRLGYGLQVLVSDWNNDGWPDLYICNDFQEDDYFYLNNQDGTFTESWEAYLGHTSRFSMGSDFADLNQDGYPDLFTLDMKPYREDIRKTAEAPERFDSYQYKLSFGYRHQYPHNALHLSQGGKGYAEVAYMAGVDATDWSWSALFCDLDHDGQEDLFVTNGIARRPNDMDYIKFLSEPLVKRELSELPSEAHLRFIEKMPSVPLVNPLLRRNDTGYGFTNMASAWGMDVPGFSNGAAYADLDLDGDLDLIVNHWGAPAGIYRNQVARASTSHSLQLDLRQSGQNPFGIGAKVMVFVEGEQMTRDVMPIRGFLSSQPTRVHVSWPDPTHAVDSVHVRWPDGLWTRWTRLDRARIQRLDRDSGELFQPQQMPHAPLLEATALPADWDYRHQEDDFVDFNREPLMPHMHSREGPAVAMADLNGDGIEDFFLGGAVGQAGTLYVSEGENLWRKWQPPAFLADSMAEDVDAYFADFEGDGVLELVVLSGGNVFEPGDPRYVDRLYVQTASGWERSTKLPNQAENSSCVAVGDMDGDGHLDFFVGGRGVPGSYGLSPKSFLWKNDGRGNFIDVAESYGIDSIGMITGAQWLDWDGDGQPELVTVGEWEPIRVWKRVGKHFQDISPPILNKSNGWWNTLRSLDLDGDGDEDLVAGNLGWNSDLRAKPDAPCFLYVKDFDGNGSTDPIICRTINGRHYPWASRDELLGQLAFLRRKYPSYASFANETIENVLGEELLRSALRKEVFTAASVWLENQGGGKWVLHELSELAQIAPIYDAVTLDLDRDGKLDLIVGGNFFGVGPNRGRYDASRGTVLLGKGGGTWLPMSAGQSGLDVRGEIRRIFVGIVNGRKRLWFFRSDDVPMYYWQVKGAVALP